MEIKQAGITFYSSIQFENNDLTLKSKGLIKKEILNNQLKGFFTWEVLGELLQITSCHNSIILLEFILENYKNYLESTTIHEIYNFLLHQKIANKEYQNGLSLFGYIEKHFNKQTLNFAITLGRKAVIFRRLNRSNQALICLYEALEILNSIEDSDEKELNIFVTNNIIAQTYSDKGEMDNAINIFEKNLKGKEAIGDQLSVSICYSNLGELHIKLKNYKIAITYYLNAQKVRASLNHLKKAETYNPTLAELYIHDKNFLKAKEYILKCKNSNQALIKAEAIHLELQYLLKTQKKENFEDHEKLTDLRTKSLDIIEKSDEIESKIEQYKYIAEAYAYTDNYKETISTLNKRHQLYVKQVEDQKIESYQQIKESHEIQLQFKELEKKESLLQQKEKLNIKLKKVNDELEQFTSMASHDLKSPLRTILAISGLIKKGELDRKELISYLELIESDAIKMNNLVNSLLKYSKIGFHKIEMRKISLNDLVKGVINNLQLEINKRKTVVNVDLLPTISGNRLLLQQLFENLIVNALKYNDSEWPEINIKMAENGTTIKVCDNGIGIPKNRITEIFKAFTRAHSANIYEGSGVGLATCKKVMNIHNGSISVKSKVGEGSCFSLVFGEPLI